MTSASVRAEILLEARKERINYPLSYGPKNLQRQIKILCERWPEIEPASALALAERINLNPEPEWIEAPFCVLDPEFFGTYPQAVAQILDALIATRSNLRTSVQDRLRTKHVQGRLLESCIRQSARTAEFQARLRAQQPGPLWIVYGQFGWHHRGRSPAEVRREYLSNEYGFGLLETACMLLTHRRRFVNSRSLQIECVGDEFCLQGTEKFDQVPFIQVDASGQLSVDVCLDVVSARHAGSVTGFLPFL